MVVTAVQTLPSATQAIFQQVGYTPTDGQLPIVLSSCRFLLVTGGLQSGKTETFVKIFLSKMNMDMARWQPCVIEGRIPSECRIGFHEGPQYDHLINGKCDPTLLYWLVGSEYIMCEEEFTRIEQDLHALALPVTKSARVDAPGIIQIKYPGETYPRIKIDVKSESRPDRAFSRVSPHGIAALEAGQLTFSTFTHLNSRTIGRNAWLILIGTIEEAQPWFPSMGEAWAIGEDDRQSFELPTWSNTFLFKEGLDSPEIKRMKAENTDIFYMERMAGKRVPPKGLVFPEFNVGIHVRDDIRYVPGETVYIWVDPGYQRGVSAHACYLSHKIEGQYKVFDELHEFEMLTEDVIHWWEQHEAHTEDARLSIDPFYKDAHHAMGSVAELWRKEAGLTTSIDNKRVDVRHGDDRLAQYLHVHPLTKKPGIVFSPKCKGIISEFGATPSPHGREGEILAYVWKLGDDGQKIGTRPVSEHCDGIRAITAGLVDNEGLSNLQKRKGVTRRGGQPFPTRRPGKLPHERYANVRR